MKHVVLSTLIFLLLWMGCFLAESRSQTNRRPFHIQHEYRNSSSFFQNKTSPDRKRKKQVSAIAAGGYGLTMLYLGTAWYGQEELGAFHFFDDSHQWQQMDKIGHIYGGYHCSRFLIDLYKWSGSEKKEALIIGGIGGLVAMNSIEVFDGFSEAWGASLYDVGANVIGSSLAVTNQALWNENRIQLKVGYRKSHYAGVDSLQRLLGSNPAEWFLKDYNGQTLWMSFRVHSFLPEGKFKQAYPRWLNLAVGYGAEGLIGEYDDPGRAYRSREFRQYYLALDIDLSNIRTRSGFLNSAFSVLSLIRIPLPALRLDKNGLAFRALE